jgi:hypothetical protein
MTTPDRLAAGREVFARAITLLLTRNGMSHAVMAQASSWANPDGRNWLSTSQISYYRTQHNKILGPKPADALGQLNLALAMLAGDESEAARALEHLGKPPRSIAMLLEEPFYLRHPATMEPCNAGDLFMIWIGRLRPYELQQNQNPDAITFSADVSRMCQEWILSQGLTLREGMEQLLRSYPSKDAERLERLRAVVAGLATWDEAQVGQEIEALAAMVGKAIHGERFTARELMEVMYGRPSTPSRPSGRGPERLADR